MNKKIQKILIMVAAVVFISTGVFVSQPKKASALFGVGDFNVSDVINALKEAAQYALVQMNHSYTERYVQKLSDRYRINDYATYARNLAENVYSVRDIATRTDLAAYLVRVNISKLNGTDTANTDLKAIYTRESLKNVDYSAFLKGGAESLNAYRTLTDPLISTPMGQRMMAEADAQSVFGNAQAAAAMNIANSHGQKDLLDCRNTSNSGTMTVSNCLVDKPAEYVTSQLDSKISSLFNEQLIPQDHLLVIKSFFGSTLAKKLGDALLGTSNTSSLVDDLALKHNSFSAPTDQTGGGSSTNTDSQLIPCLPDGITLDAEIFPTGTVRAALNNIGASCTSSYIKVFADRNGNEIKFSYLYCEDTSVTDPYQMDIERQSRQQSEAQAKRALANNIYIDPCPTRPY